MNSPRGCHSPTFRNITRQKQSPIELKEKFRKNYKERIKNCRSLLINNIRGVDLNENEIRNTLAVIYKNTFKFTDTVATDEEEQQIMQEIQEEFFQEELNWVIEEYEKSHLENVDWSSMETNNDVFCPVCQKSNIVCAGNSISCSKCKWTVNTDKTLLQFKNFVVNCLEKHNRTCDNNVEFTKISTPETHIYLLCSVCADMQLVL